MGLGKGSIAYGITWRLLLLKDLSKPPRPIRVYMSKIGKINQGLMSYGITWRLMLLKDLSKPPRPIRIYMN